jgi:protein TonB
MQDRVADVLAQRSALDRGGAGGVAMSLLLHGSVVALAVYAATHQPRPVSVNALKIRFASPSRPTAVPAAQPAPVRKPAAPRIEPPKPEPLKPADVAKPPDKNTVPLSPFGKSAQKGSENPAPPKPKPPAAAAAGTTATTDIAVGQTGVTGLDGGDFPYTIYIDRMKSLVGSHWFRPPVTTELVTVVYFAVERDGRIRDPKTEVPSGNGAFDRAALRAVLESSPLPPLPFGYNGTYLGVHLTFR